MTTSWSAIDARLEAVVATPVVDERSARQALSELMSTIAQINGTASGFGARAVGEDTLADRLQEWVDRLIDKLTEIVEKIAKATSFTITVGTSVSVSVTFGPFEEAEVPRPGAIS